MRINNRELSWLNFNDRVLQEALDERVPLIERIRFLGIYSNNLDEFYRVRVAYIHRLMNLKKKSIPGYSGSAQELMLEIDKMVISQGKNFEKCYKDLLKNLEKENIFQIDDSIKDKKHLTVIKHFFDNKLKHEILPIAFVQNKEFPLLQDSMIYLGVTMDFENKKKSKYALIEIPTRFERFFVYQIEDKNFFILMDDIIRIHLKEIFFMFEFDNIEAFTFKFSRDSELDLDDDLSYSLFEKIQKSVKQRVSGDPVRFVYDKEMPKHLQNFFLDKIGLEQRDSVIPGGRYHNFKDFTFFPDFKNENLIYKKYYPANVAILEKQQSLLNTISNKDVLLHFPYVKFDYVVNLLREAALDPKVKEIKINIYRLAKHSQIVKALLNAVKNGKNVVVIMELQARFDERNNLNYAEFLRENGVKVIFGIEGLKIHSKLLYIKRKDKNIEESIAYIGTGNFNESSSKIYTDLALLTSESSITSEVDKVFNLIENQLMRTTYKQLLISPINNRRKLLSMIQNEINNAKNKKEAWIKIKINNLVDEKLINKLYQASKAGVKIQLIVRGICCLQPNEKFSKNIEAISIVGRFLEHSRICIFANGGSPTHIISSADWMERNMDKRIEVGVPIKDPDVKNEIDTIFNTLWKDNQKARIILKKFVNEYRVNNEDPFFGQRELMNWYQNK